MEIILKLCTLSVFLTGCAASASFQIDPTKLPDEVATTEKYGMSAAVEITDDYSISADISLNTTAKDDE